MALRPGAGAGTGKGGKSAVAKEGGWVGGEARLTLKGDGAREVREVRGAGAGAGVGVVGVAGASAGVIG